MTEKYYFKDMSCLEITSKIIAIDKEKSSLILDKTIFHVKGGGQPGDHGTIDDVPVLNVIQCDNQHILHTISNEYLDKFNINSSVILKIDPEKRNYHSRLHSAGHLLAGVVEKNYSNLKAISGNHIPGQCKIVFKGTNFPFKENFIFRIESDLESAIATNKKIKAFTNGNHVRTISIENYHSSPCGGTHVSTLSELGCIKIRKFNIKKDELTVGYDVTL